MEASLKGKLIMTTRRLFGTMLVGMSAVMVGLAVGEEQPKAAEAKGGHKVALPLVTLTGADSHVKERSCHLIRSEKEWIKIWQRHKGVKELENYDLFYNPLGLPEVNFDKCIVIAAFQGSGWNSAGLRETVFKDEEDRIVLQFEDKAYQTMGPGGGGEQVTVYGFFVLPRSDKTVVLEENVQNIIGSPPVWKERARFSK
jgi:hypothetical protein